MLLPKFGVRCTIKRALLLAAALTFGFSVASIRGIGQNIAPSKTRTETIVGFIGCNLNACRSSGECCQLVIIRKKIGGIMEDRDCARGAENVRIGAAAGDPDCL